MTVETIEASLVRRLDWRFLVPTPADSNFRRMVLLGGDRRLADAAVAIGLAGEVSTALERDSAADLIAVLPGADIDAADLTRAAAPGGVIYIEVDRRRRGSRLLTPHRLADRLTGRGQSVVARYALRPHPEACELFVPIDDSPALGWFLSSVYVASSAAKVLGEVALWTLLRSSGRRVGRIAPFHATVAVLPPASGTQLVSRRANGFGELYVQTSTAMIIHGGNRVVQFRVLRRRGHAPLGRQGSDPTEVQRAHSSRAHDVAGSGGPRSRGGGRHRARRSPWSSSAVEGLSLSRAPPRGCPWHAPAAGGAVRSPPRWRTSPGHLLADSTPPRPLDPPGTLGRQPIRRRPSSARSPALRLAWCGR